jgi:4-diphosphocytidyl-2C-methyl-D-erythritol kinase
VNTRSAEVSERRVRLFSPAKLNLELRALDLRADGYRELDTEMVLLDFGDELELARSSEPGVRLTLAGPALTEDIPDDDRNLAVPSGCSWSTSPAVAAADSTCTC